MIRKYATSLLASMCLMVSVLSVVSPLTVSAQGVDVFKGGCNATKGTTSSSSICGASQPGQQNFTSLMKNVINTMIFVVGLIAVIMIVIGGLRYVVSNGESQQIQSAKNTVLYSVVGLVVAISAYAIVNFVLDKFK